MNRYKSSLPKLGIRIIVDGRCNGVRDKIEASTRRLAENVKELVESNINIQAATNWRLLFLKSVSAELQSRI